MSTGQAEKIAAAWEARTRGLPSSLPVLSVEEGCILIADWRRLREAATLKLSVLDDLDRAQKSLAAFGNWMDEQGREWCALPAKAHAGINRDLLETMEERDALRAQQEFAVTELARLRAQVEPATPAAGPAID